MTPEYVLDLMPKIPLDDEATVLFTEMSQKLFACPTCKKGIEQALTILPGVKGSYAVVEEMDALCAKLAEQSGYHPYQTTAFVYLLSMERLQKHYAALGLPEDVFGGIMADFACWIDKCRSMHGITGVFVGEWLWGFHCLERFTLGRLQFEPKRWKHDPIRVGNHLLRKGDLFVNFHIPSFKQPFDRAARQDAYQRAASFFADQFAGEYIPLVTETWLLDPLHRDILPPASNMNDFARDFDVVIGHAMETYYDAWRIFDAAANGPVEELPENNSLQRAYKARMVNGETCYYGTGVLWVKKP